MTIHELSELVMEDLVWRRYADQGGRIVVKIENSDIFSHCEAGLKGVYGEGNTHELALANYVAKIKGKILVVHAVSKDRRREFGVPPTITSIGD